MGGSSIGVLNNFIPVKSPFAKNAWRNGLCCVYFLIPAIIEFYKLRKTINYSSVLTLKKYKNILLAQFMQVLWVFGLTYASSRTIQSHAYLINNTHGLFIVVINLIIGKEVLRGEIKGLFFAIFGCIVILLDPQAHRTASETGLVQSPLIPNLINLSSAFLGAIYFLINAKNVNSLPIMSLVLFQNIHLWVINSTLAKILSPSGITIEYFSTDMNIGCLGFFDPRIALIAFIPFGILCSVMGSAGYTISLLFYSPLVVSNAFLIEPLVAQLLGFYFGFDDFPGIMTFIGAIFTITGLIFIDRASRKTCKQSE